MDIISQQLVRGRCDLSGVLRISRRQWSPKPDQSKELREPVCCGNQIAMPMYLLQGQELMARLKIPEAEVSTGAVYGSHLISKS